MAGDICITHAIEDRMPAAAPLAARLAKFGIAAHYERCVVLAVDGLRWGMERALRESNAGLVVLSPAFFAARWPQEELDWLGRQGSLLPLTHGIRVNAVAQYSEVLAGRIAGDTGDLLPVIRAVAKVIDPRRYTAIYARRALLELGREYAVNIGEVTDVARLSKLQFHPELTGEFANRLVLVRICLQEIFPSTESDWLNRFRCEPFLEQEVKAWETIAACYVSYLRRCPLAYEQRKALAALLIALHLGSRQPALMSNVLKKLPESCPEFLAGFFTHGLPDRLAFIRQMEGMRSVGHREENVPVSVSRILR